MLLSLRGREGEKRGREKRGRERKGEGKSVNASGNTQQNKTGHVIVAHMSIDNDSK